MKLTIDPGHGGNDSGASASGITESDLNLILALKLRQALLRLKLCEVGMTREHDHTLSLSARGRISKKENADLVLSLHANASDKPHYAGLSTFHWPGNAIGESVATQIAKAAPFDLSWPRPKKSTYEPPGA